MFRIIYLAIIVSCSVGCSSKNKIFQDKDKVTVSGEKSTEGLIELIFPKKEKKILKHSSVNNQGAMNFKFSSKIIPGDELKIEIFNKSKIASFEDVQSLDPSGVMLKQTKANQDYIVDEDGTIYLPLIGEITISGLSQSEATQMITEKYNQYLNKPYAKVKLKSTRIYVLGEVAKPGMIPVAPNGITIFEALAKVGDFTDYAKKDQINIISGKLGKQTMRVIDLSSMKSINKTNFMIRPDSIVYVSSRIMKDIKYDVSPILSLVSQTLSTYLSLEYISNARD